MENVIKCRYAECRYEECRSASPICTTSIEDLQEWNHSVGILSIEHIPSKTLSSS